MAILTRFRRTISQPADGGDFFVVFADEGEPDQSDDNYGVFAEEVAGASIAGIEPLDDSPSDRTASRFRVVTTAPLPDGAVLEFIVVRN